MRINPGLLSLPLLVILTGCSLNERDNKNQASAQVESLTIENIFPFQSQHCHGSWLSKDEGKTWPHRKILINGPPGGAVRGHYSKKYCSCKLV